MKITKYLHSCLFVEDQGKKVLVDPGSFSTQDKAISIEMFDRMDAICYTHDHFDHFNLSFLKELVKKFPGTPIFTPNSIKTVLAKEKITAQTAGNEYIKIDSQAPHEKIWGLPNPPTENILIELFGRLATPGDSLHFQTNVAILALPVTAPWGATTWAVEKAVEVKPKVIIPIHDWHWKDEVRKSMYDALEQFFAGYNIKFLKPEAGQVFEV